MGEQLLSACVHVWVCVCSLSQVHIKSLIVTVTSALCCVLGSFPTSFPELFSSLGLLFALSTPNFNIQSLCGIDGKE